MYKEDPDEHQDMDTHDKDAMSDSSPNDSPFWEFDDWLNWIDWIQRDD